MRRIQPETDWWMIGVSAALFVVAAWLTNVYGAEISALMMGQGIVAALAYLAIVIVQVVLAPINTAPLVPIAVAAWGELAAVGLTLLGWAIGSTLVFWLVRRLGLRLLRRVLSDQRITQLERLTPDISTVIALRLLVPIDLVSYALGFVPGLSVRDYLLGTLIGYLPWALLYAYLGDAPLLWQIVVIVVGVAIVTIESPRWFSRLTR